MTCSLKTSGGPLRPMAATRLLGGRRERQRLYDPPPPHPLAGELVEAAGHGIDEEEPGEHREGEEKRRDVDSEQVARQYAHVSGVASGVTGYGTCYAVGSRKFARGKGGPGPGDGGRGVVHTV